MHARTSSPPKTLAAAAFLAAALALLPAAGCSEAPAAGAADGVAAGELVAERGTLHPRVLLTGELRAERAEEVVIPRSPSWQMQIRWMEENGTRVESGQKVLELENEEFARELEEKRLAAAQQSEELTRLRADAELHRDQQAFAVRQRKAELAKAEIAAAVPPSLLAARDYQEHQLALERARVALAKAEEDLAATVAAGRADVEVAEIELARARREIETAEAALDDLSLEVQSDGILVVEEHPWEGRPLQAGDTVWVGMTVMRIPDLTSMQVTAELPDVDDGEVTTGMEARCSLDAHPDRVYAGRVTAIGPIARRDDRGLRRYFQVEIALEEADPERMRPGMSVKVELVGDPEPDSLLVPRAALDLGSEPARVRLAGGGWRPVRVDGCDAQRCAVEPDGEGSGGAEPLAPGQRLARLPYGAEREAAG